MPAVPLTEVVRFLDEYLDTGRAPDYPNALNGLQVDGHETVRRVAVAVDARESVIGSVTGWADLLIVHHGLFWGGLQPLTGPQFRRVRALVAGGTALYSAHLPLDSHPEAGNAAILARKLGLEALEPFGEYSGTHVGWKGTFGRSAKRPEDSEAKAGTGPGTSKGPPCRVPLADFARKLSEVLGSDVVTLPGGPESIASAAVVTGSGASTLKEAADAGADVLVTGEAQHHHAIDAAELGVTVLLGGHYETETWGVRRIGEILADRFGIECRFVDSPTGL